MARARTAVDVTGIGMIQGMTMISARAVAALAEGLRAQVTEREAGVAVMMCRS